MATLEGVSPSTSTRSSSRLLYARNQFAPLSSQAGHTASQATKSHQPYNTGLVASARGHQPTARQPAFQQQRPTFAGDTDPLQSRKRQLEFNDPQSVAVKPPNKQAPSHSFAMPGPSSRTISPPRSSRTLPSFHNPRAEEDEEIALAKRRRLDEAREEAAVYRSREGRHIDNYDGTSTADRMTDRRIDEGYDANVPLARRRGDAAQAKASRLHIDTGYGTDAGSSHSGGGGAPGGSEQGVRSSEHPSRQHVSSPHSSTTHSVKSAPPYKATFFEREHSTAGGAHYDPRAPGPELPALSSSRSGGSIATGGMHGAGPAQGKAGQYYSSTTPARYGARQDEGHGGHEPAYEGHVDYAVSARRPEGMPSSSIATHAYRGPQQPMSAVGGAHPTANSGTPLTASRMGFVPQTATLPSPAYHTTQFFRNGNGGGAGPHSSAVNGANGGAGSQQPPRTAGLNPPMTARLPDHLRSPPSSKTQFLSLFSNFYDSLQDSRTLKATLEDQVRRSNTLLQTLQRSARVLELTVERRLTAERSQWESKVHALEERCRRLERKTGTGSPTPPPPPVEADQNDSAATAAAVEEEGRSIGDETAQGKEEERRQVDVDADESMRTSDQQDPAEKTEGKEE